MENQLKQQLAAVRRVHDGKPDLAQLRRVLRALPVFLDERDLRAGRQAGRSVHPGELLADCRQLVGGQYLVNGDDHVFLRSRDAGSEGVFRTHFECPFGTGVDALTQAGDVAFVGEILDGAEQLEMFVDVVAAGEVDCVVAREQA